MLPDKESKREEKGTTARAEGVADADIDEAAFGESPGGTSR